MTRDQSIDQGVRFALVREGGQLTDVVTDSPAIDHFLRWVRLTRSRNTWVSYAHDLKAFFGVVTKPPEDVTRADCLAFMEQQDRAGRSDATVNRRLAAVSSLFGELHLLDSARFAGNPVVPVKRRPGRPGGQGQTLYRRRSQRVPRIVAPDDLRTLFRALPTWRDRTLVLLMWISCLRISEALAMRFSDVECSHRRIVIAAGKGGHPRTVYMDAFTFAAFNRYLDLERGDLFPEQDAVFVAFKGVARGRPLSVNALQKLLRYQAAKCGVAELHAHRLRHTGITQLLQQGMAEPAIRQFVGHRRPESLLPYLHLADTYVATEFARAQEAFEPGRLLDVLQAGGLP
jgi:integrase/recombinase XerD